ncbi:unnamed protein product, partial [Prorocentrum cordatum]
GPLHLAAAGQRPAHLAAATAMAPGAARAGRPRPLAVAAAALLAGAASGEGWKRHERRDCVNGRGGYIVSNDTNPIPSSMSLEDCQQRCAQSAECWGVQVLRSQGAGAGGCFFRREIDPADCYHSDVIAWDVYVRPGGRVASNSVYTSTANSGMRSDRMVEILLASVLICIVVI